MAEKSTILTGKPKILVFAGPNGSGKSTIAGNYKITGLYINADDIKKHKGLSDLAAAEEAEKIRGQCLIDKRDFTFETVLSTLRNLKLLKKAKKAGYHIECIFVLTTDPELNIFRIRSRVLNGGHDVPEEKIRNRYTKSLANIPELLTLCNELFIIDNTSAPSVIFSSNTTGQIITENPYWPKARIEKLISPA
jgi:predicted ABC-type ATPase